MSYFSDMKGWLRQPCRTTLLLNCAALWALLLLAMVLFHDPLWWHEKPLQVSFFAIIQVFWKYSNMSTVVHMYVHCNAHTALTHSQMCIFRLRFGIC